MKRLFSYLIVLFAALSLSSCYEAYATTDVMTDEQYVLNDNVDINVIVTYGTPYYWDGYLSYYYYRGLYYYYMYYDGYWYWRAYHRPFANGYRPHWTPRHHDRRFSPGHYGFERPHNGNQGFPKHPNSRGIDNHRKNIPHHSANPDNRRVYDRNMRPNNSNSHINRPSSRPSRSIAPSRQNTNRTRTVAPRQIQRQSSSQRINRSTRSGGLVPRSSTRSSSPSRSTNRR